MDGTIFSSEDFGAPPRVYLDKAGLLLANIGTPRRTKAIQHNTKQTHAVLSLWEFKTHADQVSFDQDYKLGDSGAKRD
jgi:hypothetical protein